MIHPILYSARVIEEPSRMPYPLWDLRPKNRRETLPVIAIGHMKLVRAAGEGDVLEP